MSLRKGEIVISGISRETKLNAHSLLDFKWCDHILNEMSWLRADTFSWQSGDVYTTVYNLLEAEYQNGTEETESGITFKRSPNGYKITTDENGVIELYNGTGVAWFYILDTENRRFKLPRTQFGFTGLRDGVGAYVDAGLPNIRGSFKADGYIQDAGQEHTGAFYSSTDATTSRDRSSNTGSGKTRENFDASRSNSIYGNSDTVQPKATQMYLYFYVGEFSQTATEQTAGLNAEMFNTKADVSTVAHRVIEFQEPTAENDYTWYRKYADGWVEQGGQRVANKTVSFPVVMANTNYFTLINSLYNNSGSAPYFELGFIATKLVTGMTKGGNAESYNWFVAGMAA